MLWHPIIINHQGMHILDVKSQAQIFSWGVGTSVILSFLFNSKAKGLIFLEEKSLLVKTPVLLLNHLPV